MSSALADNLKQPTIFAVFVSVGIHLLALSGLQAATRDPFSPVKGSSVNVVQLTASDVSRLPGAVQQQVNPNNLNNAQSSFALFPPFNGKGTPLPGGNPGKGNGQPFYQGNFNAPGLDSLMSTLPPPPENGWFNGNSVPMLKNPVVIPDGNGAPLPNPPALGNTLGDRMGSGLPPAPSSNSNATEKPAGVPTPSTAPSPPVPSPASKPNSILEAPQTPANAQSPTVAVQPSSTPDPAATLLPSADSQIQALRDKYHDRYLYNPADTTADEAQGVLNDLLPEMRSATGQPDLQPEAPIGVRLAFPDPVCPRDVGTTAIVVLVDGQGYVIKSHLIRSSGYDFLDQKAMANVNQRQFGGQAKGRYTLYEYQVNFADLDRVCFTDNA